MAPGDALALDVHVVSDLRHALAACVVTATLSWDGGQHEWRWAGDVDADACVRIGTVEAVVPAVPGALTLTLELAGPVQATNRYDARVT